MSRSDQVYINDIIESVDIILSYTDSKTEHEFLNDLMLQDAVVRRFEILGEAGSKISDIVKKNNPMFNGG